MKFQKVSACVFSRFHAETLGPAESRLPLTPESCGCFKKRQYRDYIPDRYTEIAFPKIGKKRGDR
jgi:hypothetical protein